MFLKLSWQRTVVAMTEVSFLENAKKPCSKSGKDWSKL